MNIMHVRRIEEYKPSGADSWYMTLSLLIVFNGNNTYFDANCLDDITDNYYVTIVV